MKLVLKNSKLIAFFLMAIIYVGCSEDVVELPKMTAGFTYTLNENKGTVEFINISENATTYSWDFGDEIPVVPASTSLEVNPIKSYMNGTYTVILKAMNAAGAISYFEDIIVINMPLPLGLPMTFDNDNVNYSATAFDGVAYEVVENPAPGGSNDVASMVASITNSGAAYEGLFFELQTVIDLTTNNTIRMNFWSDAAVSILLKLEQGTAFKEVPVNHTGSGWEELQFTFTTSASYSKLVVFVDPTGTKGGTFYMDDIVQVSLGDAPVITLIGDASIRLAQGDPYTEQGATASDTEDGDVTSTIVIGGDTVDTNTLGTYAVTYMVIDSDGNTTVTARNVQVIAPGVCDVDEAQSVSAADLNVTMASAVTIIEDGATFQIIDNPDFDNAINTSCKVGKVTKQGVAAWDNIQLNLNAKLDFNSNSGLKIKVWSARPNTAVLIKLEEIGNQGNSKEIGTMTTSVTSGWEELTYAVGSGESNKFNKVVIFFDLNANNTSTYYFDDLKLYGDGSGTGTGGGGNTIGGGDGCAGTTTCPAAPAGELLFNGNFEACDCDWQLLDAVGSTISTSINNGGSKSGQIQGRAGVAVGLKQERLGVGTIQPNTTYTVTYDIKASGAFGEGGVFKAFTFSEPAEGTNSGATLHTLTAATTSMSSNWERKSYEFTTPAGAAQVAGGLSFLIEIVNSTANATINIDNVVLKIK
ncbi:hypothetical protein BST83_04430 [Polaribacter filamentus]|uniref:PKD domain-containing protein n=1 Tax=Polaribacter filamentus TaxID=53483 RepID=A0A2S7KV46_9FLAO|nr:immunoglobulin-like domain-containing protein [Polaribacter filamentus]PQB06497.1 hypothetical protein BST83_04430 [Polaribacter filamentus]